MIQVRLLCGRTHLNGTSTAEPARVHAGSSQRDQTSRGSAAFALHNEIAEFEAISGVVSKRFFLENAMLDRSTGLRQYMQVHATVPLRARLNGHTVVAGLPVPTDDLIPVAGGPS